MFFYKILVKAIAKSIKSFFFKKIVYFFFLIFKASLYCNSVYDTFFKNYVYPIVRFLGWYDTEFKYFTIFKDLCCIYIFVFLFVPEFNSFIFFLSHNFFKV